MRLIILVILTCTYPVCLCVSSTLCESDLCVCKLNNKSDKDDYNEIIDCSYYPNVLQENYDLPSAVYSLDLSWNNITYVNSSRLLRSTSLTELFLNNNRITDIALNALQLPRLQRLDLSNNALTTIARETFRNINKLQYLNIANNKFHTLSEISFHHLANLVEIILDNNNLGPSLENKSLFDRNGYGLTNKIRSLSISGIKLNIVRDNFFVDAYDLRKLVISKNNLTDIFELPFTLQYLDISDNPITEISSEDLTDMPALKELKLNNLNIREVPDYAFAYLPALTHLELERNRNLSSFSELAFGQAVLDDADDFALETLSLKGSGLRTLSEKLLTPFGQLIHLDLQGNMWKCDCNLRWIKKLQIQEAAASHLRCYTPKSFYNSKIKDLEEQYFVCQVNNSFVGATIGIIATCVVLTAMAVWIFIFVPKNQSRYSFVKEMSNVGYTALPVHVGLRRPS